MRSKWDNAVKMSVPYRLKWSVTSIPRPPTTASTSMITHPLRNGRYAQPNRSKPMSGDKPLSSRPLSRDWGNRASTDLTPSLSSRRPPARTPVAGHTSSRPDGPVSALKARTRVPSISRLPNWRITRPLCSVSNTVQHPPLSLTSYPGRPMPMQTMVLSSIRTARERGPTGAPVKSDSSSPVSIKLMVNISQEKCRSTILMTTTAWPCHSLSQISIVTSWPPSLSP